MQRELKITMSVESNEGNLSTISRTFIYNQGITEDLLCGMFLNFIDASSEFCIGSVGFNLPTYFDEFELTEKSKKQLGLQND